MNKKRAVTFAEMRGLLENLGYRHIRVKRGEIFHLSDDRELYFRRYGARQHVSTLDLARTRGFLDDWNQLEGADFDAFLESTTKPA